MNSVTYIVDGGGGATLTRKAVDVLKWLMEHANRVHHVDDIARAVDAQTGGRTVATYITTIRRAMGDMRDRIISAHGTESYGYVGDAVTLVPCVKQTDQVASNAHCASYAVMTRADVAKRLGITEGAVALIEKRALSKLRASVRVKKVWKDMLATHRRTHFDPFYEMWLFSVQKDIEDPFKESEE